MMGADRFVVMHSEEHARRWPDGVAALGKWDECWVCVDMRDGSVVGSDGGEPEDQLLVRDWRWVPEMLNALNVHLSAAKAFGAADAARLTAERDAARDALRALVNASDDLDRACVEWERGDPDADIDAAKLRYEAALKAARGVL